MLGIEVALDFQVVAAFVSNLSNAKVAASCHHVVFDLHSASVASRFPLISGSHRGLYASSPPG